MDNKIIGRYSEDAKVFLVTCPFCKHTTRHTLSSFNAKQWIGSYVCYGGEHPKIKGLWQECGKELIIIGIK